MLDRLEEEDFSDYWSVSKLQTLQQCGKKFKFQYVEKVPVDKDATLKFGTAVHTCLEMIHRNNLFTDGEVQRLWADVWTPYVSTIDWDTELVSKTVYKNRGLKMLTTYIETNKDDEVLDLEKRFRIESKNGLPKFGGMIDKIIRRAGRASVVDYKTSKYSPDPLVLKNDPQLTMYYMACKELGYEVEDFAIHTLIEGKEYWTKRSDDDIEILMESIKESQDRVKQKMFARNIGFMCKNCSFKEICLGLGSSIEELPPSE